MNSECLAIQTKESAMSDEKAVDTKMVEAKKEHMMSYIKSIAAIDAAIEPYKQQKKDLKSEYLTENWLNKEDMKRVHKAYQIYKQGVELEDLFSSMDATKSALGELPDED